MEASGGTSGWWSRGRTPTLRRCPVPNQEIGYGAALLWRDGLCDDGIELLEKVQPAPLKERLDVDFHFGVLDDWLQLPQPILQPRREPLIVCRCGTSGRGLSVTTRATTACAVAPVNGGSAVSISYSTAPKA